MPTGAHKPQSIASVLISYSNKQKWPSISHHIVRVTADETWVSFVNVETKEQSKQWMQLHSPNSRRKLTVTVFWNRKGFLIAVFML
jgi:hypothetical protein